mgnify:FL=1
MRKIIKLFIIILSFFILTNETAFAAAAKGNADVYKVTMRKIEMCTGYTVVDFDNVNTADACHDAVVIGSGDLVVDIASVDAGAAAASYGEPALLPLGETYTHMRVTVDRKFIIKSESAIDTGGTNKTDNCVTVATTDAQYGSGSSEAARKYTHKVAVAEGGTNAEMNLYMTDGRQGDESSTNNYTQCEAANCAKNDGWTWDYAVSSSQLTSAIAMQTMRSSLNTDDVQLVYELTTPYTVSLIPPIIDISFGTRSALGVQEVCDAGSACNGQADTHCSFYPEEPIVTITIK